VAKRKLLLDTCEAGVGGWEGKGGEVGRLEPSLLHVCPLSL
jgi:hypothetical protein